MNYKNIKVKFCIFLQNHTQSYKEIVFHTFDPVIVQLSLDSSNIQHEKLIFKLVKPYIHNFSVPSVKQDTEKSQSNLNLSASEKRKEGDAFSFKSSSKKKKNVKTINKCFVRIFYINLVYNNN